MEIEEIEKKEQAAESFSQPISEADLFEPLKGEDARSVVIFFFLLLTLSSTNDYNETTHRQTTTAETGGAFVLGSEVNPPSPTSSPLLLSITFNAKMSYFSSSQLENLGSDSWTVIKNALQLGRRYRPLLNPFLAAYVGLKGISFLQQLLPEGSITAIGPASRNRLILRIDGLFDFQKETQNEMKRQLAVKLEELFEMDIKVSITQESENEEADIQAPVSDEEAQELEKWIAQSVQERSKDREALLMERYWIVGPLVIAHLLVAEEKKLWDTTRGTPFVILSSLSPQITATFSMIIRK